MIKLQKISLLTLGFMILPIPCACLSLGGLFALVRKNGFIIDSTENSWLKSDIGMENKNPEFALA